MINIALPKGRLGEKVYHLFEKAGYEFEGVHEAGRRLVFVNKELDMRCFWVKPFDVPVYVERGVADIGAAGKDILMERNPDVYELLDLNVGKCRMCVAGLEEFSESECRNRALRVATEFPNIARDYYSGLGREIDVIVLRGSLELAPVLGLSDVIVDIVETGTTLRENNLAVIATIAELSARLIANKSAFKFKGEAIHEIIRRLQH
ncbi:MAG: ATP phosphoribosyltransferase [Synergistaceae bacterium]|nr:ATP phosphoribosyltransferase [Synergistaceae bacterium]MBQ6982824.1 ATP phosphoribosyltransferase [Synergistaceae bacterium]